MNASLPQMGQRLFCLLSLFACQPASDLTREKTMPALALSAHQQEPIKILPPGPEVNPAKAELGRHLFFDPILSHTQAFSCATCHQPQHYGTDAQSAAIGLNGQQSRTINTPTIFNAVFNISQFWNGRAENLFDQAEGPILDAAELAGNWDEILARLRGNPDYLKRFLSIFKALPTREAVLEALATYQMTLTTPHAPFDRYLEGDNTAISETARSGYEKFKAYGCVSCHQGSNIGGNMYQKMGVARNYFEELGRKIESSDWGRFTVTHNEADRYFFRVPSLRNIAETAPYFHDGSAPTLESAVLMMANYQLGINLNDIDTLEIVAFLKTLTAPIPAHFSAPASPPTGGPRE